MGGPARRLVASWELSLLIKVYPDIRKQDGLARPTKHYSNLGKLSDIAPSS